MDKALYQAISKRKSFHMFRGVGSEKLTEAELAEIRAAFDGFERLYPEIRTAIRIVSAAQVNFKHDAEYCVMLYSEKKDNWLMNAGYIGEQLDLWLTARDIGSLWFGIGKPDEPVVLTEAAAGESLGYYRDENDVHYVPKRRLEDVVVDLK